jgi:hypothetical protein
VGTPVSAKTAGDLEKAMQAAISLQPYVRSVSVVIDRSMLEKNAFGYGELAGSMINAEIEIDYEGEIVRARLQLDRDLNYPLMSLL